MRNYQFKIFKGNGVLAGYVDTIKEAMSITDKNKDWYFKKKGKLTEEELDHKIVRLCINKQLEPYGITYDDVKKEGKLNVCRYYKEIEKKNIFLD